MDVRYSIIELWMNVYLKNLIPIGSKKVNSDWSR